MKKCSKEIEVDYVKTLRFFAKIFAAGCVLLEFFFVKFWHVFHSSQQPRNVNSST